MATTDTETRSEKTPVLDGPDSPDSPARATRTSRSGRGPRRDDAAASHEEDLDLLTAALIGLTVGVGVTMLLRRRPAAPRGALARGVDRGARLATLAGATGSSMARKAARGARRGYDRGKEMAGELSMDGVGEQLHDYFEAAKGAIEDTVSGELQDLRKSIRRRRRRLGI